MKRAKLYLALLLFCFHSGVFSVPISEDAPQEEYDIVRYAYKGHIDTKISVGNETLARWTISGDLYAYSYPDFFYMKLENVKTSVFNGPISDLGNVEEKPIPPDAKIIEQMFAVKVKDDFSATLYFKENEPLWSINMKKGIYNFVNFEYEKPNEKDGKILPPVDPEGSSYEESLFGNCLYNVSQEGLVVTKTKSGLDCKNAPVDLEANFNSLPEFKLNDVVDYQYKKVLTLQKRGNQYKPYSTVLKTKTEFKSSPSAAYTQIIEQEQSYEVLELYVSTEKIDASQFTKETDLVYEVSEDSTSGRHVEKRTPTELAKKFLENYDAFVKRFNYSTPEYYNVREDYIFNMYEILQLLKLDDFEEFEKVIFDRKDIYDLGYTYFSLIPYVGTDAAVQYLIHYMRSERINGNIGFAHKVFATFPKHIHNPTDKMLVEMEPFINHPTIHKSLKNSAILSFASTVGHNCDKSGISKKYTTKYIEQFHKDFLEEENYEDRMVKLMGLVNMGPCINYELMNSIATNTSESSYLRVLALTGFKNYLKQSNVYETYWPIVQKKSEPFEVRVRALDLLLASKLSEDQFKSIVSKYSESFNDPEEKQLANYVLSSLHSLKKSTGYHDYVGEFALEALKDNKIPTHPKGLASGYYRLAYTDSDHNLGSSLDVRVITDPETNILDTLQVSFNNFAHYVDYGTYTVYFKLHGFLDWAGVASLIKKTKEASSIPELVNLLKEYKFEIKSPKNNGHIDIIFFKDNTAIFTRHYSEFEPSEFRKIGIDLEELLSATDYVSYPILEYAHIPSDFGTPIEIYYYEQEYSKQELGQDKNIRYRSSWSFQNWYDIYNPLADTYISNYRYYVDEKNLFLNFTSTSVNPLTVKWLNEKDTFATVWENMMGTMAEKDALKEYCPKCDDYSELEKRFSYSSINTFRYIGFEAEVDIDSYNEIFRLDDIMLEFIEDDLHQYNTDALPYAGPVLFFANVYNYKHWLRSELARGSFRTYSINGKNVSSESEIQLSVQVPKIENFGQAGVYSVHFESHVRNVEDNEPLNSVNVTVAMDWDTDFEGLGNEPVVHKVIKSAELYFKYNTTDPEDTVKVCGYGGLIYPDTRSDKLSLLPFESVTEQFKFVFANNTEDDEECIPETAYTFKQVYSSNNLEVVLEEEDFKKDYEKCAADSKGLKFTAPTEICKKVSSRITEYDNYEVYIRAKDYSDNKNETMFDMTVPFFKFSRVNKNTIKFAFTNIDGLTDVPKFNEENSFEVYYPEAIIDLNADVYNPDSTGIFPDTRSTCTITPSKIEQFSGKYVSNKRNELLAFANCYSNPSLGLKTRTVDDKHVGFTFYSFDKVIEATVKDAKVQITLNGKQITEFYSSEDKSLKIYFLDQDAVYIVESNVEIYYNTEYVASRVNAVYPKILCGVCTE